MTSETRKKNPCERRVHLEPLRHQQRNDQVDGRRRSRGSARSDFRRSQLLSSPCDQREDGEDREREQDEEQVTHGCLRCAQQVGVVRRQGFWPVPWRTRWREGRRCGRRPRDPTSRAGRRTWTTRPFSISHPQSATNTLVSGRHHQQTMPTAIAMTASWVPQSSALACAGDRDSHDRASRRTPRCRRMSRAGAGRRG